MVLTKRRKRLLLLKKKSPFDSTEPRGSTPAQVVGSTVVANPSRRERILHYGMCLREPWYKTLPCRSVWAYLRPVRLYKRHVQRSGPN
ncbi:hypothetical protein MTO96_041536 [Rhipicephalus appendiculatus]